MTTSEIDIHLGEVYGPLFSEADFQGLRFIRIADGEGV
jgi:hypothetical protein